MPTAAMMIPTAPAMFLALAAAVDEETATASTYARAPAVLPGNQTRVAHTSTDGADTAVMSTGAAARNATVLAAIPNTVYSNEKVAAAYGNKAKYIGNTSAPASAAYAAIIPASILVPTRPASIDSAATIPVITSEIPEANRVGLVPLPITVLFAAAIVHATVQ